MSPRVVRSSAPSRWRSRCPASPRERRSAASTPPGTRRCASRSRRPSRNDAAVGARERRRRRRPRGREPRAAPRASLLAVDRSVSMKGAPLEDAVAAARAFVAAKPAADRIAVATFATDAGPPDRLLDLDDRRRRGARLARGRLGRRERRSTTRSSWRRARFRPSRSPARVIIVVTDGRRRRQRGDSRRGDRRRPRRGRVRLRRRDRERAASRPSRCTSSRRKRAAPTTAPPRPRRSPACTRRSRRSSSGPGRCATSPRRGRARASRSRPRVGGDTGDVLDQASGRRRRAAARPRARGFFPSSFLQGWWGALVARRRRRAARARRRVVRSSPLRPAAGSAPASRRTPARSSAVEAEGRPRPARDGRRTLPRHRADVRPPEVLEQALDAARPRRRPAAHRRVALRHARAARSSAASSPRSFGPPVLRPPRRARRRRVPARTASCRCGRRRRLKAFDAQLPDLLTTVAASLKAGHSFRQGIQAVVDEGQEPSSKEFQRVLTETRLGRPMDGALAEMSRRVGSKNLEFVLTAVTIQRQVGGSLAAIFDMVAETVRNRHQFARKVKGLTAMGRASAYVLIALPFFVALAVTAINAEYMSPLYHTSTGHKLMIARARDDRDRLPLPQDESCPSRGDRMLLLSRTRVARARRLPDRRGRDACRRGSGRARSAAPPPTEPAPQREPDRRPGRDLRERAVGPAATALARVVLRVSPKATLDGINAKLLAAGLGRRCLADRLPGGEGRSRRSAACSWA